MSSAKNWTQRKTFIYFCKYAAKYLPAEFFKKHFMKEYIACSQDRVPHVRMEFANAMLDIKPYFDKDVEINLELMDILNGLQNDEDRDVIEAVEHTDYELLQCRKKTKNNKEMEKADKEKIDFRKQLVVREKIEAEERKKRVDDEEESKYDMASFLAESKKWRQKATKYPHLNRRPLGGMSGSKASLNSGGSGKTPISKMNSDNNIGEKSTLKKTKTIKPKANHSNISESDFSKNRKNSLIVGGSKDEQIKRYHAMVSG